MTPFTRLSRAMLLLVVLALVTGACAAPRPSVEEWRATWNDITAEVPSLEALGTPPDHALCQSALGHVREGPNLLLPSPDPAIDATVHEWLGVAEGLLFECDSHGMEHLRFEYDELAVLAAEIEAALGALDS